MLNRCIKCQGRVEVTCAHCRQEQGSCMCPASEGSGRPGDRNVSGSGMKDQGSRPEASRGMAQGQSSGRGQQPQMGTENRSEKGGPIHDAHGGV